MINRLCIIGVGLIGGSLARALRAGSAVGSVVGCGRGELNLRRAVELDVIDEYQIDPIEAVRGADVVVVATTLGATSSILHQVAPHLDAHVTITDVGSAKSAVVEAARAALGPLYSRFVPGHPIAGTEKSGVEASFTELFRDHRVILTPDEETDAGALDLVIRMWRETGASVIEMPADRHDELLAATSHLPHMLAYAFVECLASMPVSEDVFQFAAGGFRDFSRIASSNPAMWSDIAIDNRGALLTMLDRFARTHAEIRDALERSDRDSLRALFERAKQARDIAMRDTVQPS